MAREVSRLRGSARGPLRPQRRPELEAAAARQFAAFPLEMERQRSLEVGLGEVTVKAMANRPSRGRMP
jgi:hypothetical protein